MNSTYRHGFTLLEVTLVIGILAIILSATMVVSYNALVSSSMRAAENILVQTMRRAQTMSQNNVNGKQWGVYICDTNSLTNECNGVSNPAIVLYGRDGVATFGAIDVNNDQLFEINSQIVFSGTLFDSMTDPPNNGLTFARASGDPLLAITDPSDDIIMTRDPEFRTVSINSRGVVER